MRIWDALEPSYRLSLSYMARVVRIDPDPVSPGMPVVSESVGSYVVGLGRYPGHRHAAGKRPRIGWSLVPSLARGEALVAVPGIPVTTWEASPGPVMGAEVDA